MIINFLEKTMWFNICQATGYDLETAKKCIPEMSKKYIEMDKEYNDVLLHCIHLYIDFQNECK